MKYRFLPVLLALCLLLTGCFSWMDGQYVFTEPYEVKPNTADSGMLQVTNYQELCAALEKLAESSAKTGILSVEHYAGALLESNMATAIRYITKETPIGAYAVESITYEQGKVGGVNAFAVTIEYNHNHAELPRMMLLRTMSDAGNIITNAVRDCDADIVMKVENYEFMDLDQLIEDYALQSPASVMEIPQVAYYTYPKNGPERILEVRFTYQTSRESLKTMQAYVQPVFASAKLYVSGEETESSKFGLLYAFLMERHSEYTLETSITPTYSLLAHGVGDSRAFAVVYASMCRNVDLECMVVSGTCEGEARTWNIICEDGVYYHVDLLRSNETGVFTKCTDAQMEGYVWDYSAYPACTGLNAPTPDATEPTQAP